MKIDNYLYKFIAITFGILLLFSNVWASILGVEPVNLFMLSPAKMQKFFVTNYDNEAVILQINVYDWEQNNGVDHYVETKNIAVNPPVVTILPHKTAMIRLGLLNNIVQFDKEYSYKIKIREIPLRNEKNTGVKIITELNLPLFVTNSNKTEEWNWEIQYVNKKQPILIFNNCGNVHAKFNKLQLFDEKNHVLWETNMLTYVLANKSKNWTVTLPKDLTFKDKLKEKMQSWYLLVSLDNGITKKIYYSPE